MIRQGNESRRYVRVEYNVPAVIKTSDVAVPSANGALLDIGADGVLLEVDTKLYSGMLLSIEIENSGKEPKILAGYIRWTEKTDEKYMAGVMFDETRAVENDRIVEIITEEIIGGSG
ncbi:MAG: PilZ domain-containing protein [Elusimicrobiota bacterium]